LLIRICGVFFTVEAVAWARPRIHGGCSVQRGRGRDGGLTSTHEFLAKMLTGIALGRT
jgi:hypothetical protein